MGGLNRLLSEHHLNVTRLISSGKQRVSWLSENLSWKRPKTLAELLDKLDALQQKGLGTKTIEVTPHEAAYGLRRSYGHTIPQSVYYSLEYVAHLINGKTIKVKEPVQIETPHLEVDEVQLMRFSNETYYTAQRRARGLVMQRFGVHLVQKITEIRERGYVPEVLPIKRSHSFDILDGVGLAIDPIYRRPNSDMDK